MSTTTYEFKVNGMDCAEEVGIIKRVLKHCVKEEALGFDLLNGKLSVVVDEAEITEMDIIQAINKTGMKAVPYRAGEAQGADNFWHRRGRQLMTLASGIFLVFGLFYHANLHGFLHALTSGEGSQLVYPTLAVIAYLLAIVCGAWFIIPKALYAAKSLRPDMNLLMMVAVIGAIIIGQWFEAASVSFLFALALLLESWSVSRARNAVQSLMALAPLTARYRLNAEDAIEEKAVAEVPLGATVIVRPGEKVPMDGVVTKGTTTIDQAPITGESIPVEIAVGSLVYAGTINQEGAIEFKVNKTAQDSTLSNIIHMVEQAQSRRAKSQQWVESFARYYTPAMLLFALVIALVPPLLFNGVWIDWFYEALVILVIACPCALVISTPVSVVAGLTAAAKAGVLIKGGTYLELPAKLQAIAFDKTGTLTQGKPTVQQVIPGEDHSTAGLLKIALALESNSHHPLARAICDYAKENNIEAAHAENFKAIPGKGAEAKIDGRSYWIGSHRLLHERAPQDETSDIHQHAIQLEKAGHSIVIIGAEDHICGLISVADKIREETPSAIQRLKQLGIAQLTMLTGDNLGTAEAIAKESQVDSYHGELLPADKVNHVTQLVKDYESVAMVGDGVNDAPALATANLGIAMGAMGSDAAIETADIALMSDDIAKLPWLVKHSRRSLRIIKQNIVFSLLVKAVFILLAILGLATLWMAIAADMGTSLIVIFNGLRLLSQSE